MTKFVFGNKGAGAVSRRRALELGVAATGATLIPGVLGPVSLAYADDKPAIGTWPAGSAGRFGHHRRGRTAHRGLRRFGRR